MSIFNMVYGKKQNGWKPWANTIAYYDFEQNLDDSSGNGYNATGTNIWYEQVWWQYVITNTATKPNINIPASIWAIIGAGDFAVSFWLYPVNPWSTSTQRGNKNCIPMIFGIRNDNSSPRTWPNIFYDPLWHDWQWSKFIFRTSGNNATYLWNNVSSLYNSRHHIVMTRINGTVYCYLDASLLWTFTWTDDFSSATEWRIFSRGETNWQQFFSNTWAKADKYIIEKAWWTAQEVADYYNQTKSTYGL